MVLVVVTVVVPDYVRSPHSHGRPDHSHYYMFGFGTGTAARSIDYLRKSRIKGVKTEDPRAPPFFSDYVNNIVSIHQIEFHLT